ncbi:MAG: hypothetical protein ACP6IP_00010 [Candidatus Njordarchaeia archaeon]
MYNWEDINLSFRAKDIRGIFGVNVFPDLISRASTIFANIIQERGGKKVAVSGDGRLSSEIFMLSSAAGIASAGLDVVLYPPLPITIANFAISQKEFDGGTYVTASHNPPEWNGIRFRREDGTGFTYENKIIKERFKENKVKWAEWNDVGNIFKGDGREVLDKYINFALEITPTPDKSLKIVLDPRNGIGGIGIPELFSKHHTVYTLNSNVDGSFKAGPPDPVDTEITSTIDLVKGSKADFGIVFDGDADRGVIIDENGRRVPAESVGIILAEHLLKPGDVVIANLECSSIIREKLEPMGFKVVDAIVGDVFISEKIKEVKAKLAVENSYHLFLPMYGFYYDDVIIAEFILASIVANEGKPLSKLVEPIGNFVVLRENVEVPETKKWDIADRIKEKLESQYSDVVTIDGVKVYFEHSSVLIRPSNTEPLIRIIIDARSDEEAKELLKKYRKLVLETIEEI